MTPRSKHNSTLVSLAHAEAFLCHYCGRQTPLREGTRDHIVPKAYGGTGFHWNLVYSCGPCNHGHGHSYLKCDCSKCASARLRWALEDISVLVWLAIHPKHREEVKAIRDEAREAHGLKSDCFHVWVPA